MGININWNLPVAGLELRRGCMLSCWLPNWAVSVSGSQITSAFLDPMDRLFAMLGFSGKSITRTLNIVGGYIDYIRDSTSRRKWSPFNGQIRRRDIFDALRAQNFAAIIETGAHLGTTTQYFGETSLPVFSLEGNPRRYGFAKARLLRFRNVSLRLGDTRSQLPGILAELGPEICHRPIFFYLDAHWKNDLPLADELAIVLRSCAQPIIMIDDFEVAGDPGYGFDDYGEDKALVRAYIEPFLDSDRLSLFYPSAPSSEETGFRRGCVVLTRQSAADKLASLPQLRLAAREPSGPTAIAS
jgi:hypothetical protein